MKPTNGNHPNLKGTPTGTLKNSSTGGFARLSPISVGEAKTSSTGDVANPPFNLGGRAKKTWVSPKGMCKIGLPCGNLHCEFTHPPERKVPTHCMYGNSCKVCFPCCPSFQNCQVEECPLRHDLKRKIVGKEPVSETIVSHPAIPVSVPAVSMEKDFPSLRKEGEEVKSSAPVDTPMKPAGVWGTKTVEPEKEDLSPLIPTILSCFDPNVFGHLKEQLKRQLEQCETGDDLLEMCVIIIENLKRIIDIMELPEVESLFNDVLSSVMTLIFGADAIPRFPEAIDDVLDKIAFFATLSDSLTSFLQSESTPVSTILPVSAAPEKSDLLKSGSMVEKHRLVLIALKDMLKNVPVLKQGDLLRVQTLLSGMEDIQSCTPELVQSLLQFATTTYTKIMDQIRIEEEARLDSKRLFLFNPEQFQVSISITESQLLAMAYMFAISFMVGSNITTFDEIINMNAESATLINKDQKGFFDQLVRAIYRKIIRSESDARDFQNAVITSDFSRVSENLNAIFSTAISWFLLSQKSSESSVYESLKLFSSWNESQLLNPVFLEFLYSDIQTRDSTQIVQIWKIMDNHMVVILKYFGVHMVSSETGFGKKFVLSYKNDGNTNVVDVSDQICDYLFDILCMSKVFVDTQTQSFVPHGNPGVGNSISKLFDLIGNSLIDGKFGNYQCYKAQTKTSKEQSEFVPKIFCPIIFTHVSSKLKQEDGTVSHRDVLKYFLDNSKKELVNHSFRTNPEKDHFRKAVSDIRELFLPSCRNADSMMRFRLFLSTLKSDPMTKLMKMGIEFLTNESFKKDVCNGLAFLNSKDVGEFQQLEIRKVIEYMSTVTDDRKLKKLVDDTVLGFEEALKFVASSGISLVEVLHVCDMFKDLYNKNKSNMRCKMVFFNFFLTSIMVAASKKWNLTFQTMYTCLITSLMPNNVLKETKDFKENIRAGVNLIRLTGFQFATCERDAHCDLFCKEACANVTQNSANLESFNKLIGLVCPVTAFSDVMFKQDRASLSASMSISDCFDRVSMFLLTTHNRDGLLDLFKLTKPTVETVSEKHVWYKCPSDSANSRSKMHPSKIHFETEVLNSIRTSIKSDAISKYFLEWNAYLDKNRHDITTALSPDHMKQLRIEFRKNSEMETFFNILINSGLSTEQLIKQLRENPNLYTPNKRGTYVLNIIDIAKSVVAENNGFSLQFYEDILRMIHSALYPNFDEITAVRQMVRDMVAIQMAARRKEQGQAPVEEEHVGFSMCDAIDEVMFVEESQPEPECMEEHLKNFFLGMLSQDERELVCQRIDSNPVVLICNDMKKFFTVNHDKPETLPESLSKYLTESIQGIINISGVQATMNCFSNVRDYIENFFDDDEDEGIDLCEFRNQVLDESSELSKAFNNYVAAAITEAMTSVEDFEKCSKSA